MNQQHNFKSIHNSSRTRSARPIQIIRFDLVAFAILCIWTTSNVLSTFRHPVDVDVISLHLSHNNNNPNNNKIINNNIDNKNKEVDRMNQNINHSLLYYDWILLNQTDEHNRHHFWQCPENKLPPLLKNTGNSCPDKYLIFHPYEQFNNHMKSLIAALVYGSAMNRTVILTDAFGYKWSSLINTSKLCTIEMSYDEMKEQLLLPGHFIHNNNPNHNVEHNNDEIINPIRYFNWGLADQDIGISMNNNSVVYKGIPLIRDNNTIFGLDERRTHAGVHCITPQLLKFRFIDEYVTIGNIFASGIVKSTYVSILKHINFIDEIKNECQLYINRYTDNKPYIAIHLRWLDGTCYDQARNGNSKYANESLQHCDMTCDYVSEKIRQYGYDPNTIPIFLAHDNQRPEYSNALLNHTNVFVWNDIPGYDGRMMDMCLMRHSSLFLGNALSSMSFHVALWREIDGHSPTTNILPSYDDGWLRFIW